MLSQTPPEAPALTSFLLELQQPIPGDHPAGTDVTYEDDFGQIKAEIDLLSTASANEVDFGEVVDKARLILTTKSKDIRVACFLALALARMNGLGGLAEGLTAVHLLMEHFWEDLHPQRMNARRNALQLLPNRLKDWVAGLRPRAEDQAALEQALVPMKALQAFCLEAMGEQAPVLSGMTRALEDALRRAPKATSSPRTSDASAEASADPSTDASTLTSPVRPLSPAAASPAESAAPRSSTEAKRQILRLAAFLREDDPAVPESYLLTRALRWGMLSEEPPHEDGKTLIEPPDAQRRVYLSGLLTRGDLLRLVLEAEQAFQEPSFHFWLDLQRMAATAMEALGDPYQMARDAVAQTAALLIRRVPRLPDLAFKDGTPFADPLTQDWLASQAASLFSDEGVAAKVGEARERSLLEERYGEARTLLGRGDLAGALDVLSSGQAELTPQDQFWRQLYVAELCIKGDKPSVARPVLEALSERITHHALETWDPALALRVWANLHRSYTALASKRPEQKEAFQRCAERVFKQVCRVDPRFALANLKA